MFFKTYTKYRILMYLGRPKGFCKGEAPLPLDPTSGQRTKTSRYQAIICTLKICVKHCTKCWSKVSGGKVPDILQQVVLSAGTEHVLFVTFRLSSIFWCIWEITTLYKLWSWAFSRLKTLRQNTYTSKIINIEDFKYRNFDLKDHRRKKPVLICGWTLKT